MRTYVCECMHARTGGGPESSEGAVVTHPMTNGCAKKATAVLCHGLNLELLVHERRLIVLILLAP